jgi:hypothetical protein
MPRFEPAELGLLLARTKQRGPLLPSCAQAAARFRPSRQHVLLTPPVTGNRRCENVKLLGKCGATLRNQ